jgi:hypothetical protein
MSAFAAKADMPGPCRKPVFVARGVDGGWPTARVDSVRSVPVPILQSAAAVSRRQVCYFRPECGRWGGRRRHGYRERPIRLSTARALRQLRASRKRVAPRTRCAGYPCFLQAPAGVSAEYGRCAEASLQIQDSKGVERRNADQEQRQKPPRKLSCSPIQSTAVLERFPPA